MGGPDEVKVEQRATWTRVAAAWKRWAAEHRVATRPVSEAVLRAAALEPGLRVLDVACGAGDPALEAARRVAPDGRVVAIDLSAEMLATARELAAAEGVGNIEFLLADGDRPPPGPFDAVICRFGLMFFPDPVTTAAAWREAARPGGRVVAAVWTGPDENPFSALRPKVARDVLGIELAPASPGMLALALPGALEEVFRAGGLREVTAFSVAMRWEASDAETLATMLSELNPPLSRALRDAGPEKAALVHGELARALAPFVDREGSVSVPACAWVGTGLA